MRACTLLGALALCTSCAKGTTAPQPQPAPAPAPTKPTVAPPVDPAPTAMSARAASIVTSFEAYYKALRARDLRTVSTFYTKDATITAANSGMTVTGPEGYLKFVGPVAKGFPDIQTHVPLLLVKGDDAVVFTHAVGTHTASLAGMPATGKKTSFRGLVFMKLTGDAKPKISWQYNYSENINFLGHLGMFKGAARPAVTTLPDTPTRTVVAKSDAAESRRLEVALRVKVRFNAQDLANVIKHYDAKATFDIAYDVAPIQGTGPLQQRLRQLWTAFPDLAMTGYSAWAAGNYVVSRYTLEGTHKGRSERFNKDATNKRIKVAAGSLMRFNERDQIVEHHLMIDGLAIAVPIGAFKFGGQP